MAGQIEARADQRAELLKLLLERDDRVRAANQQVPSRKRLVPPPLSFAQERLWLLHELELVGSAYNIPVAVRLGGRLDVGALERAFVALVVRHEALRTHFAVVDGKPVQVIDEPGGFRMAVEDLSALAPAERDQAARERSRSAAAQPFDLDRGPLFRVSLLKLSEVEHVVLVGMHHSVSDGWSMGILIREVGLLYSAFAQGQASPLPALPVQYADYAVWQREWLQGEVLEQQLSYWKDRLGRAPAVLELPTDRPRPATQSYRGAAREFALSKGLSVELLELARREGASLFMVLLAAFQIVLSRWSGQTDVVVGTPTAGRKRRELEGLIGCFLNMLALRTDLSGDPSFRELLGRVKESTLGAFEHQDIPFERLIEALRPARDLSRQPIFQASFTLQNVPLETLHLPGLTLRQEQDERTTAKLDLSLYLQETPQGVRGVIEYATDLFDGATIDRMAGHLRGLLEGIVVNADARISALPLLSAEEREQVLVRWNDTATDYPNDRCLHELFEEQAARTPAAVALVFGDQELSYGELDRRSNQFAHYVRRQGVGPDVVVGLCVERSFAMVVGLLGILKAGGAYLPLDPDYPQERLTFMAADAKVVVLVTQASLADRLATDGVQVVRLDTDWTEISACADDRIKSDVRPDNLAYVIYTSGSTGKPKGVMVTHRIGASRLQWGAGSGAEEIYALKTTPNFVDAVWEIFMPLIRGGRVVLMPIGKDVNELVRELARYEVTRLALVPSLLQAMLEVEDISARLPKLSYMMVSGELLPPGLAELSGRQLPAAKLFNVYGTTECWDSTCYEAARGSGSHGIPLGRPIANRQVYVLDGTWGLSPIGAAGELHIGGVGLARGYLGRPGLTAERFVPNPYGDGERLYRTGDLVRWRADGELEFLARMDHQVKLRGYRIELGEIEAALSQHPAVRQAVVVAREDGGDRRLTAYLVASESERASTGALRAHLKRMLPDYMVPADFVALDALPLMPNGKVDRSALPAPEHDVATRESYVMPRTAAEEVLASICAEVLKLDLVGVDDNFFELGGHSLLAMGLVARIRDVYKIELPLRALFESPTVAQMALIVEDLLIGQLESP